MRLRILVLPLAAVVISAMCWHKLSQDHTRPETGATEYTVRGPAPDFEALDKDNSVTRLKSFLGRHNLLVVFFDDEVGAASDEVLQHLKHHSEELRNADYHVIAVSSALPQHNRHSDFPRLFHLLTDPEPIWKIHREWGCFDDQAGRPRQAVYHVDRAGNVATSRGVPVPLKNPGAEIDALLGVSHDEGSH